MFDPSQYLGNFQTVVSTVVLLGGQVGQLVKANPNRVILYISPPIQVTCPLWWVSPPQVGVGQYNAVGGVTVRFTWLEDGPMSTYAWWAAMPTSPLTNTIAITEIIWSPTPECG